MNKVQTFFRTLYRSLIDPIYYKDVISAKISFSLKYFFVLHVLIVFISSSAFAFTLGRYDVSKIGKFLQSVYPRNFSLHVQNGEIELNQNLPFVVPIPKELEDEKDQKVASPAALVVFDTNDHMSSISSFWSYNALAVVTKNEVYYRKDADSREIRVTEIPKDVSFEFSSTMLDEKISSIVHHPFFSQKWYVPILSFFYFLVSFPFVLAWSFVVSFLYALFSYIVIRAIYSSQFSYSALWQMTIHALTGGIILSTVTDIFGFHVVHGVIFFLLYGVWMYVVIKNLHGFKMNSRTPPRKKRSV
ncbi:DUF1189 family protein [Candidatus Gottesmanbacteria bacterium]|nr:DUF1189 family protein [Candidatus Gottesmanbacteria bacterium]